MKFNWTKTDGNGTYKDLPEKTLQKMANDLENVLMFKKDDEHGFCEDFFNQGFVTILGYEFSPCDPIYVLVAGEDQDGSPLWYELQVPSKDDAIVQKYIKLFYSESDVSYFIMPQDAVKTI